MIFTFTKKNKYFYQAHQMESIFIKFDTLIRFLFKIFLILNNKGVNFVKLEIFIKIK